MGASTQQAAVKRAYASGHHRRRTWPERTHSRTDSSDAMLSSWGHGERRGRRGPPIQKESYGRGHCCRTSARCSSPG